MPTVKLRRNAVKICDKMTFCTWIKVLYDGGLKWVGAFR